MSEPLSDLPEFAALMRRIQALESREISRDRDYSELEARITALETQCGVRFVAVPPTGSVLAAGGSRDF